MKYIFIGLFLLVHPFINAQVASSEYCEPGKPCDSIQSLQNKLIFKEATFNTFYGDSSLAIKLLKAYLLTDTTCYAAYLNLGVAYSKCKDYANAEQCYQKAQSLNSYDYRPIYNQGYVYWCLKQYEKSIDYLTISITMNPAHSKSYYHRGNNYAALKYYDLAIADFNKAIELDHNKVDYYKDRGITYSQMHKVNLALSDYKKGYAIDPTSPLLNGAIAAALIKINNFDSALYHIQIAMKVIHDSNFNLLASYCYLKKNDKINACHYFKEAQKTGLKEDIEEFRDVCK